MSFISNSQARLSKDEPQENLYFWRSIFLSVSCHQSKSLNPCPGSKLYYLRSTYNHLSTIKSTSTLSLQFRKKNPKRATPRGALARGFPITGTWLNACVFPARHRGAGEVNRHSLRPFDWRPIFSYFPGLVGRFPEGSLRSVGVAQFTLVFAQSLTLGLLCCSSYVRIDAPSARAAGEGKERKVFSWRSGRL